MTDRDIVKKDIEELYLGNLGTVEFDLDLPSAGKNGSTITDRKSTRLNSSHS